MNAAQGIARATFPADAERQKGHVAAVKENAADALGRGEVIKPYQVERYQVERSAMDRARAEVRQERLQSKPLES